MNNNLRNKEIIIPIFPLGGLSKSVMDQHSQSTRRHLEENHPVLPLTSLKEHVLPIILSIMVTGLLKDPCFFMYLVFCHQQTSVVEENLNRISLH